MLDNVSSEINEIKDIKIADLEISNFNSLLKYLQSYKENFGNDKNIKELYIEISNIIDNFCAFPLFHTIMRLKEIEFKYLIATYKIIIIIETLISIR